MHAKYPLLSGGGGGGGRRADVWKDGMSSTMCHRFFRDGSFKHPKTYVTTYG